MKNPRYIAYEVLTKVLNEKTYLNIELKNSLSGELKPEDKRFITALVNTVIENLYRIDYCIDFFVQSKRLHGSIRNILRLGVCQIMFLESVPNSAAVNESVKLTKTIGKQALKGFVNGTLRNVAKNLGSIKYPNTIEEFLHVFYSYPMWLVKKYIADYGAIFTEEMLSYKGNNSLTCIRQNTNISKEVYTEFEKGKYLSDAYYIKNASGIEKMPKFISGEITVQGEASMMCVCAANVQKNSVILDVCAAPGGKSAYMAQIAVDGKVTALDIHPHRVELTKQTFERLKITNATANTEDATVYNKAYEQVFDIVLADVPCSALGLLYRKPDVKLFKEEKGIADIINIQRKILANCANYVKKGGILLYSTCTINKNENNENVAWFLEENKNFELEDISNYLPEGILHRVREKTLQLYPNLDKIDGFYMARLRRV